MRSGFFNSEIIGYDAENMPIFDRAEDASFFAKYFSQFISNGVFPNPSTNMQVLATEGMKIKVDIGVCYINGYMGWVENAETFEIEESGLQPRIDRVVARLDFTSKDIQIYIKKGVEIGNPVAPELQRDYDMYELGLADVRVNGNAVQITQENITDLRLNTELCGVVANHLQHLDTTTLFNQYEEWYRRVTEQAEANITKIENDTTADFTKMKADEEEAFNLWFEGIKDILDENTAGHLLNLINANKENIDANTDSIKKINENINTINTDINNLNKAKSDIEKNKANVKKVYNISIDTTWSGTVAPFTKVMNIEGMLSTDIAVLDLIYSDNLETAKKEQEEYLKISRIDSLDGSIKLTCFEEKPEIALNLRIEVMY